MLRPNQVLEQLTAHYNQNVHNVTPKNDLDDVATLYFDRLLRSRLEGHGRELTARAVQDGDEAVYWNDPTAPIPVPRTLDFWLNELLSTTEVPASQNVTSSAAMVPLVFTSTPSTMDLILEFMDGYEDVIRPLLIESSVGCVPTLQHYELFLSLWLARMSESLQSTSLTSSPSFNRVVVRVARAVHILCMDITLWTSPSATKLNIPAMDTSTDSNNYGLDQQKSDNSDLFIRRNVIVPTLLRLVERVLWILRLIGGDEKAWTDTSFSFVGKIGNGHNDDALKKLHGSLRRTVVALWAFETTEPDGRLLPTTVAPSLVGVKTEAGHNREDVDRHGRHDLKSLCCFPPKESSLHLLMRHQFPECDEQALDQMTSKMLQWVNEDCLGVRGVDWDSVALDTTQWNDLTEGTSARAAQCIWDHLDALLCPSKVNNKKNHAVSSNVTSSAIISVIDDKDSENICAPLEVRVMEALGGAASFLPDIRAHFFGRDDTNDMWWTPQRTSLQPVRHRMIMGRRVVQKEDTSSKIGADKPFKHILSRIAVALNYLRTLSLSSSSDWDLENKPDAEILNLHQNLLEHMFPICASLTDSTTPAHIALGASAFICLLNMLDQIQTRVPAMSEKEEWNVFVENSLTVMEMAFQGSRRGPLVIAIGHAQCRLLGMHIQKFVQHQDRTVIMVNQRRRVITQKWLSTLHVSTFGKSSELDSWDLLVGGVIPLLLQHTEVGVTADVMELGRLGIKALLPLIDREWTDDRAQIAASIALINLLFGAFPIMPHHGGKLMSHLLAAAAGATSQNTNGNVTRPFLVYTGAVALVMCGPKFTKEVLNSILDDEHQDKYQHVLAEVTLQVKQMADALSP